MLDTQKLFIQCKKANPNAGDEIFLNSRCAASTGGKEYYEKVKFSKMKTVWSRTWEADFDVILQIPSRAWAIKHHKHPNGYPRKTPLCYRTGSNKNEWKKAKKPLSPEAFEAVCNSWEQHMKEFILQLSDGSIPTLRDVKWTFRKKRVFVSEPDANGKKKRGACGPYFISYPSLNRTAAEAMRKKFKQLAKEHGLNHIERLRNNEKELGRYDSRTTDTMTEDEFSFHINLPGEWNKAGIHISITVSPRYRNEDL